MLKTVDLNNCINKQILLMLHVKAITGEYTLRYNTNVLHIYMSYSHQCQIQRKLIETMALCIENKSAKTY